MIDRYLIRYFLAVIDHGNFSRAAAHCNVAQPTLSVGISKLERELGAPLFVRSNQRVELTQDGARFLAHARRIENEFNLALRAMTGAEAGRMLRVGVLHSIPGERVAAAVNSLGSSSVAAGLEFVPGGERELASRLDRGRLDVALTLVGRGGKRFAEQELLREGYGLAMSRGHRLSSRPQIRAEEIAEDVMIVRRHCEALSDTSRHFTERGVRPHLAFRSTNDERVLQMVAAGLGITVMPNSYAFPGVVRPKLSGFDLERSLGFAVAHDAENLLADPPPVLVALASALKAKPRIQLA